jgi:hypothetical protein
MSKVLENLTRNPYVGLGLTAVVVVVSAYFLLKKAASDTAAGVSSLATKLVDATGLSSASASLGQAGAAIADSSPDTDGSTWSSWYDPTARTVFFYWLTFPDGTHHFVGAGSVASDATFDYDGVAYRIGNSKAGDLRAYEVWA